MSRLKGFLMKRLLGIPIVVILVFALAGGVFAANFLIRDSLLNVTVSEGFGIQWAYNGEGIWYPMSPQLDVFEDVVEGDQVSIIYKIQNLSQKSLRVWLELAGSESVTVNATAPVFSSPGVYLSGGEVLQVTASWTFPEGLAPDDGYWTDQWHWRLYRTG